MFMQGGKSVQGLWAGQAGICAGLGTGGRGPAVFESGGHVYVTAIVPLLGDGRWERPS